MRLRAALIFGALLAMLSPGLAFGQGFQGGLRGSVKDSGGVVPGVEVTLTNEATNIARSTTTNERGEYVFTNVDPGTYKLKTALQGYRTVEQPAIRIGTQQFLTLDVTLEVGRLEENITVTARRRSSKPRTHHRARCSIRRRCRRCLRRAATHS